MVTNERQKDFMHDRLQSFKRILAGKANYKIPPVPEIREVEASLAVTYGLFRPEKPMCLSLDKPYWKTFL